MNKNLALAALAILALASLPSHALQAHRLAAGERIVLDGKLDEPAWERASVYDRFWELYPQAEVAASVKTEMRVAYDAQALYVALRAFDPDPAQLRAPYARRDNVLPDQDTLVLFIDPVGKRKFAQFFRVNPRGSVSDGLYNEDSGKEDTSPDFEFEVATGRFEGGWSAEFRIPFSSLRYTDPPPAEWSIMAYRVWPRDQRYRMASSKLPREQTCFLCMNEPLTGLAGLPSSRHLTVTPNVTVRSVRSRETGVPTRTDRDLVPSLDLKWRPRPDTVVDVTVNPDFSQVELDTPQLTGTAQFALFVPEKRPFFLEGADMYEAFWPAIYTRTITDPGWGARVTQRSEAFDATVLVSRDEGGGLVMLPGPYNTRFARQEFKSTASIARTRWQMEGVTLGGTLTDRTLEGGAYNRVAGPDVVWSPFPEHRIRAQYLGAWTTALPSGGTLRKGELQTGYADGIDWVYHGPRWDQYADYEEVSPRFRADNGFINQAGYRLLHNETGLKFLGLWGFNEVKPYLVAQYKTAWDDTLAYRQYHVGVKFGLPRATTFSVEARPNDRVVVREKGGALKRDEVVLAVESNPFPWLSRIYLESAFGDRIDYANNRIGKGAYLGMTANMRPHPRAEVEYRVDHDHIDSREPVAVGSKRILGETSQQLLALWHFSARDSLRTIWQSSIVKRGPSLWERPVASRDDASTISIVYGHRRGIGTSFYVGTTFGRQRDPDGSVRSYQAEVFVKGSWSLDLL
ncbi:MAG TPA: carbohydrate binding family 9 domain-containing protein [Usitatibacter sp.]|nr:carbohydrate binding family 9 domain-containing protein [Usitatibacter sp.]